MTSRIVESVNARLGIMQLSLLSMKGETSTVLPALSMKICFKQGPEKTRELTCRNKMTKMESLSFYFLLVGPSGERFELILTQGRRDVTKGMNECYIATGGNGNAF